MTNKAVTIKVSSCSGVGKTTIASQIVKLLADEGLNVTFSDPDFSTVEETSGKKLSNLRKDITINVVTEQILRTKVD